MNTEEKVMRERFKEAKEMIKPILSSIVTYDGNFELLKPKTVDTCPTVPFRDSYMIKLCFKDCYGAYVTKLTVYTEIAFYNDLLDWMTDYVLNYDGIGFAVHGCGSAYIV